MYNQPRALQKIDFRISCQNPCITRMVEFVLEAATTGNLWKQVFLNISQNSQENTCNRFFFNKVEGLRPPALLRKRLQRRCLGMNFCEIFKNIFFTKHIRAAISLVWRSSAVLQKMNSLASFFQWFWDARTKRKSANGYLIIVLEANNWMKSSLTCFLTCHNK